MQTKLKNICDFYAITHKLKSLLRKGWIEWSIKADRVESVAEHIYGTQMLAFAIDCEFDLKLDIKKILLMLAIHELGETIVGDITIMDNISPQEKHSKEMDAVISILAPMSNKESIMELFLEFENNISKEAIFAHMLDKLECDFQVKYYEEMGLTDFATPREGILEKVRLEIKQNNKTLAKAWINNDIKRVKYDDLFLDIANFILENDIFKK